MKLRVELKMQTNGGPMIEPNGWVQRITPQLRGVGRLIALGCGTGEQLAKLAAVYPPSKILVIEKNSDSVRDCRKRFSLETTEINFLVPKRASDVLSQPIVLDFIKHCYTIVRYSPGTAFDPAFYDEIEGLVSGRTEQGFSKLIECRPEFAPLFDRTPELSPVRDIAEKRISIKNIMAAMSLHCEQSDALLIRALGELIA